MIIILFIVGLYPGTGAQAQEIIPYLQTPSDTSIWVSWKTDFGTTTTVLYGTDSSLLDQAVSGHTTRLSDPEYSGDYYYHSVQLTGLQASTTYYYRARAGSRESQTYRFRTQPPPGSMDGHYRFLILGDHQNPDHDGYQRLMRAAEETVLEKYGGPVVDHINLIINDGDQVDQGTLWQYEHIHFGKSAPLSPYLPIMTAVGNHETYGSLGLSAYYPHYFYDAISYKGIPSPGGENYYSFQVGRVVFVMTSSEHPGQQQVDWVQQIVDSVKNDSQVDWLFSVGHRPIQAEQFVGDISTFIRDELMPVLTQTEKSVLFISGHHHLYARGQLRDDPMYHIISGAASWDQFWGQSVEKDFDDVQKTIDYWTYQIVDLDLAAGRMEVECYAIGSPLLGFTLDNILIDSFHREFGKTAPDKPAITTAVPDTIQLPFTFTGSAYQSGSGEALNSTQYQFARDEGFTDLAVDIIRDFENLYGTSGPPDYLPVDIHENLDILEYPIAAFGIPNGKYYVRVRYRDQNTLWSEWSDPQTFVVTGSTDGVPEISTASPFFPPGEPIEVQYRNTPGNPLDWIGIYRRGETPGVENSTDWDYVTGSSGSVTLQVTDPGEYFIGLFADDGYVEITERIPVFVLLIPRVEASKPGYATGEAIEISYSNAPSLSNDWIGIYRVHDVPGSVGSTDWQYVSGESGTATFSSLPAGYYYANYFLLNEYTEPGERFYFTVGDELAALSTDKAAYTPGEDIRITLQQGPGLPGDRIRIFKDGDDSPVDSLALNGLSSGVLVYTGTLDTASYHLALFLNGTAHEISNRADFRVQSTALGAPSFSAEEALQIYPSPTSGLLHIDLGQSAGHILAIRATTLSGKEVLLQRFDANERTSRASISISGNAPGIYLISCITDQSPLTRRVVLL